MPGKQIFQTNSSTRWRRFKWSSRALIFFVPLAIGLAILAYNYVFVPDIPSLKAYKQVLVGPQNFLSKNSLLANKYKGFRQYINQKELTNKTPYRTKVSKGFRNIFNTNMPCNIRSAFYVTWNQNSFASLQRNVNKLNLVIPEWIFINPHSDTVFTTIDNKALAIMKSAGINIMPMLSNFYDSTGKGNGKFYGDAVSRIINDKTKREKLIADIIYILEKNKLQGINIDLEELQQSSDEAFVAFQKELFKKFHAKGLLVTQDVIPFNNDYNYKALSKYNDFIFVMAYDEYTPATKPGPIADQKWIEAAVDDAVKKIPAEKIILGIPAYGYDWPGIEGDPVLTYQKALSIAKEEQAAIDFNNDNYNLNFSYYDEDDSLHQVFFTDAATTFNAMRFATESELAGVALWRLGSEDDRTWQFYNKNMEKDSIKTFDFSAFTNIQTPDNVAYIGAGEVLDVVSTPKSGGGIKPEIDSSEMLIAEENYDSLPAPFIAKKYGWNGADTIRNKMKLVLTFDDGPDPTWTPKILDILSEKHVPGTFFIVGLNAENNIPLVKRIYREGHEIGNHTFTHPNIAEVSKKWAIIEMESTRLLIECITGHSTILFRAPYNADFTPEKPEELIPVAIARTKNYLDVGESIDPLDWEPGISADRIFHRVVAMKLDLDSNRKLGGGNIILLHDAGGDTREATVEALPRIIDYFKARGYTFTTVGDLLGKNKDELMPAVPKGSGYRLIQASYLLFEITYYLQHILFSLFIIFIILSISRIGLMAFLTIRERRKEKRTIFILPAKNSYPLVSIIVPAYNEEVNAVSSIQNLLKTDYPNFNIIFVDDGSKDDTFAKVAEVFGSNPKIKVFSKPNGGKASALNFGIAQSQGDYVVCIDADTKLKYDAVSQLMKHFDPLPNLPPTEEGANAQPLLNRDSTNYNDTSKCEVSDWLSSPVGGNGTLGAKLGTEAGLVGAVAGNVKVGNEVNLLTKWQAIEYISSQNFDRRAFANLNAITVVPGAIGAFRKQAIEDAGGFTTDTLAEDCDLTVRIIRAGYIVENENDALAFTEAPEKLKQFIKQRFRWSFGVLQTFWKNKDILFNKNHGWLGWVAMPNILLFQYIIPFFIPLADFFMLVGLATGNGSKILPYYIAFMLVDAAISLVAFLMERERISRLIWLIPQRLIYRWLMWYVLFKSVRRAIKGELQNWGVLKRTGRVKEVAA